MPTVGTGALPHVNWLRHHKRITENTLEQRLFCFPAPKSPSTFSVCSECYLRCYWPGLCSLIISTWQDGCATSGRVSVYRQNASLPASGAAADGLLPLLDPLCWTHSAGPTLLDPLCWTHSAGRTLHLVTDAVPSHRTLRAVACTRFLCTMSLSVLHMPCPVNVFYVPCPESVFYVPCP